MKIVDYPENSSRKKQPDQSRKIILITALLLMVGLLFVANTFAQAPPGDPGCDPLDPACPIDGGLSLLIAAGIGIGARKAYQQKNKNSAG